MRKQLLTLAFLLWPGLSLFGQILTLGQLQNYLSNGDWTAMNQSVTAKGWTFYDSAEEDWYRTVTWAFGRNNYNDKAEAWLSALVFEGKIEKETYQLSGETNQRNFRNQLGQAGYRQFSEDIADGEISTHYSSSNFILTLTTSRTEDNTICIYIAVQKWFAKI